MEFIDIYNDLGQKSDAIIEKNDAHKKALIHKGVCVWIINSNNEILIQTRSDYVMFPNMLDISFSGHIQAGETSLEAAVREGKEELGIDIEINKLKYLFSCREYGGINGYFENEIDDVFIYKSDIPIEDFKFYDNEVKKVSYISLEQFEMMLKTNFDAFVPYETHYLFLLTTLNSRLLK